MHKSDEEKLEELRRREKSLQDWIASQKEEREKREQKNLEEIDNVIKIVESYRRQISNFRDFQSLEIMAEYTGNPGVYSLKARELRQMPGMRIVKNLGFCGLLYCEDLTNINIRIHSPHFGIEIAFDEWLSVYDFDDLGKAVESEEWTPIEDKDLFQQIYQEIHGIYDCARRCKYKYDSEIAETYNFKIRNLNL